VSEEAARSSLTLRVGVSREKLLDQIVTAVKLVTEIAAPNLAGR
jgi:hypothetical protein